MSKILNQTNALNWFELYVTDFDRAKRFYQTALDTTLEETSMEGCRMGMFPFDQEDGIGGAITKMEGMNPGPGGTIVYLNVEGKLDAVLQRIPQAGGTVLRPRMSIDPHGFIAIIKDTEGNVVGLHSMT